MKIYLAPNPGKRPDAADGGIRRVLDAQIKYLPEFGIDVTDNLARADVTVGHIDHLPIAQGKPFVSHCHGLYWSEYDWGDWERNVNRAVTDALVQADAITAPSQWVANAITYGLLRSPRVIYHGVEVAEWTPPIAPGGYVLWNKARADAISNPHDLDRIAKEMPGTQFVSTLGSPTANVKICGVAPYDQMRTLVNGAGVYLATARETFGIGTLEALASGVPVAGWNYGGQSEIIQQGETGYLAPYGDYKSLAQCIAQCQSERARLSANARADAIARWQWRDKIDQYANLYKSINEQWTMPRPRVSVIVTCHNLGRFLADALASVANQTMSDLECIIVDDASTDNTKEISAQFDGERFIYLPTPENLGLSRALNFGHAHARGKYVLNLDADNLLPNNALGILADALDARRDLHIVYGGLDTINEDGSGRTRNSFPYPRFSWYGQMAHLNQLHSSAMMRREVIEQSGGYRERQWRAEDAELWCRVSSFGFRIERVTESPTLIYRWRSDSKSMLESRTNTDRDGDWCEYFPWRTARTADEGRRQLEYNARAYANVNLVPFGAQGLPTDRDFWNVYHRQDPLVSVIIPVGAGHLRHVNDALDSLVGQTMHEWEAVVVNDTGDDWRAIPGAPYARVFLTGGKRGAGAARNLGIQHARGKLIFFLDADDMLEPTALVKMVQRYAVGNVGYVYSDALVPQSQNASVINYAPEYSQALWLRRGLHAQAVLMATSDAQSVGFDETMDAWEDWDFFVRCAINGICGARIDEPLLIYRKHLGQRSAYGDTKREQLFNELRARYSEYTTEGRQMAKCCGGNKSAVDAIAKSHTLTTRVESLDKPLEAGRVRLKYVGTRSAPITFYANGRPYAAAATPKWIYVDALADDVDTLKHTGQFIDVPVRPIAPPNTVAPAATSASQPVPVIAQSAPAVTQPVPQPNAPVAPNSYTAPKKRGRPAKVR